MKYSPETNTKILSALTDQVEKFYANLDDKSVACLSPTMNEQDIPVNGASFEKLHQLISEEVQPNLSASNGGRYWGFVTGGANPVATYADWLVTTFNQNVSKGGDSIATAIEHQTLKWICQLFDLPSSLKGVFTTGATAANLLAAVTARQYIGKHQGINVALEGMRNLDVSIFSATPHASMVKSLGMAGFGQNSWNKIDCLANSEAIDLTALEASLSSSQSPHKIVIASAATVTGTDYDDLLGVSALCKQHKAWLHVDAAFGIFERLIPDQETQSKGIEFADSITLDCHKWLNVPYDCGLFLTQHPALLKESCEVYAPYLADDDTHPAFMTLGIENSRRFRAFPVWATIMFYGKYGIATNISKNIEQAKKFANWIETSSSYELIKPCKLNVVLFKPNQNAIPLDSNACMIELNKTGKVFLTPGQWQGEPIIRAALSNWNTSNEDVDKVIHTLQLLADKKYELSEPLC